jgi:hypothetical protein
MVPVWLYYGQLVILNALALARGLELKSRGRRA